MRAIVFVLLMGPLALGLLSSSPVPGTDDQAAALGGPATVQESGPNAFDFPMPGLSVEDRRAFSVGKSLFRDNWVVAPASAASRDGLGPLFNANSCTACHAGNGRGQPPPSAADVGLGMIVLISPSDRDGEPHPVYGSQLQDQAIPGVRPEARIEMREEPVSRARADGSTCTLTRLQPVLSDEAYGPIGSVRISARIGQQLIGMGLIEAVDDATIESRADPDDRDGDGISGRARRVGSPPRVGRFGWKASQATLEDQVRVALQQDIGITSEALPEDSLTAPEREVIDAPNGGTPEIDGHRVARLAHYCRVLAVPAQRDAVSVVVRKGRALFDAAGCGACHVPTLVSGEGSLIAELRRVEFHAYTDLLLHDMGEDLADHRRDGEATGREWRTPPLWGLGLVGTVNGHTRFLHDGRARNLTEAVLWHDGEALRAREAFAAMSAEERAALIAFLQSL